MAAFVKLSKRVTETTYDLAFRNNRVPGAGYAFPCDKDGNVDLSALKPAGRENYEGCVSGSLDVTPVGVRAYTRSWLEPAVIVCNVCSAHVTLHDAFASSCDRCGTEYNGGGQQLAPRRFWGEETGEVF